MKVNRHIIEPFNAWWRRRTSCEPSLIAIEAFEAGFKAGVLEARRSIERNGSVVGASTNDWFDEVAV